MTTNDVATIEPENDEAIEVTPRAELACVCGAMPGSSHADDCPAREVGVVTTQAEAVQTVRELEAGNVVGMTAEESAASVRRMLDAARGEEGRAEAQAVLDSWKEHAETAEIEPYRPTLMPSAVMWSHIMQMAHDMSKAATLPPAVRGKPADVALLLLAGRDVGLAPTQALNKIHVIEGRPTMSAEIMRALINDRGHYIRRVAVSDVNGNEIGADSKMFAYSVTYKWRRRDWPESEFGELTFTLEDAKGKELVAEYNSTTGKVTKGKDNWRKNQRDMLSARCSSEIARLDFGDVLAGVSYTPEELNPDLDVLRVDSTATIEPPEPASEEEIASIREHIEKARPEVQALIRERWAGTLHSVKEGAREPLRASEVALAWALIAQAQKDAPEIAQIVSEAQAPTAESEREEQSDEAPEKKKPQTNAEVVEAMTVLKRMELLTSLSVEIPTTPKAIKALCVELLDARMICDACGALKDGPEMKDEARCGCD